MDADRFDSLTRTLTAHPTRRTILRLLAGGALAAGLARLGWTEAKDKRRKNKKRRKPPCGAAGARCCKGGKCTEGTVCDRGVCKCNPTIRVKCGGACILAEDCCLEGQHVPHNTNYFCGICQSGIGRLNEDLMAICSASDPDGCTACVEGPPEVFKCRPTRDGVWCRLGGTGPCGLCEGGFCNEAKGRPCGTECCFDYDDCCNGQCRLSCNPGQVRDPNTCECLCGGQVCGNGETCVDGLCRSERCPAPDWYVCGATCCVPGYVCCADQPFCCNPGLRCNPTGGCRR